LSASDFAAIEAKILATGHRFAWSAAIARQRPDAYREGAAGAGRCSRTPTRAAKPGRGRRNARCG
jgi:hypothetical protein